jgi:hypothetical protein
VVLVVPVAVQRMPGAVVMTLPLALMIQPPKLEGTAKRVVLLLSLWPLQMQGQPRAAVGQSSCPRAHHGYGCAVPSYNTPSEDSRARGGENLCNANSFPGNGMLFAHHQAHRGGVTKIDKSMLLGDRRSLIHRNIRILCDFTKL